MMFSKENLNELYHFLRTDGLEKRDYSVPFKEEGIKIETVIPPCFEGYAKIMIPWSMNSDAKDKFFKEIPDEEIYTDEIDDYFFHLFAKSKVLYEASLNEFEKKWEHYYQEKQEYQDSINSSKVKNWHPVSWKEVCEIYEAHYHNEISPLSFDLQFKGKRHGLILHEYTPMRIDIATPLFKILKKHTKSNLLFINDKNGLIEECSIQDYTPPQYSLWLNYVTKKREWMTDIRHDSTCVTIGGKYNLLDDLLACKELEVMECTPLTRLDWYSDKINR